MRQYTRQQRIDILEELVASLSVSGPEANVHRANAYMRLAEIYVSHNTEESLYAAHQIYIQSQITSYAGQWGAAALFGNYRALSIAGTELYNISLDEFSRLIDLRVMEAALLDLKEGGDGILSAAELHALDYSVWRELGMGELFPGNLQRYFDSLNGFAGIPADTVIYNSELYGAGFTLTPDMVDDDLWTPGYARTRLQLGSRVGNWYDSVGKNASDFGFSEDTLPIFVNADLEHIEAINGGSLNSDGTYRAFVMLRQVIDSQGNTHTVEMVVVRSVATGEYVATYDLNANVFEGMSLTGFAGRTLFGLGGAVGNSPLGSTGPFRLYSDELGDELADRMKNALGADYDDGAVRRTGIEAEWIPAIADQECFLADTPVLMANGQHKAISEVRVGEWVKAYDEDGVLHDAPVTAVHTNYADEIIDLDDGVYATPGHVFMSDDGNFARLGDILERGGGLVSRAGATVTPSARTYVSDEVWRQQANGRFEAAWAIPDALKNSFAERDGRPVFETFNLTVGGLHTYIAGSYRVHNDSLREFLPEGIEYSLPVMMDESGQQRLIGVFPDGRVVIITGKDYDGDQNTDLTTREYFLPNGSRVSAEIDDALWQQSEIIQYNESIIPPWNFSGVFSSMGSSLGALLADGDVGQKIVFSSVLGAVGVNLGQLIGTGVNHVTDHIDGVTRDVFSDFGSDLANAFQGAAIGTVSSYFSLELGEALGLEGFGAELVQTVGGTVFSTVFSNALSDTSTSLFQGFAGTGVTYTSAIEGGNTVITADYSTYKLGALEKSIGAFLGAKLGALVIQPTTTAGAYLSSIGSTVGSMIFSGSLGGATAAFSAGLQASLSKSIGWAANFVLPGIGSFIGFVVGAFIGNLFGSSKPKIPTANAETVLNFDTGYFETGEVTSANGGNEDLVRDMSIIARDTINGFIELAVYGSKIAGNANLTSPTQVYGHTDSQLWVKLGSSSAAKVNFDTAGEATDYGSIWALKNTKISGGDLFVKRAIHLSRSDSVLGLGGDVQIATDYAYYYANQGFFNSVFAAPYESLSISDRAFYDSNSTLIHRVMMMESQSLSSSDQSWYNGNKTRVDSIIDQLGISQFAAGWLITLQRAAELGLNQTSRSDFYGGLGGLVDSLQIMAPRDFYQEDVQLSLDGTTLNVDYGRWSGDAGENLMRGGDLSLGTGLLADEHNYAGAEGSETIETIDGQRALVFRDSGFYEAASGTLYASRYIAAGGDVDDGKRFSVNGGEYISWAFESKQLGDSRNRLYLNVSFFDSNGVHISDSGLSGAKSASWKRSEKAVVAPSAAAFAELRFYVYGRAGDPGGVVPAEAHVAARNIQFNRSRTPLDNGIAAYSAPVYERWTAEEIYARGGFTAMSNTARSSVSAAAQSALLGQASLYIGASGDLMSAEYSLISQTGADASSGNDIHIHSGSHGVTIDDLSSETGLLTFRYFDRSNPFEPNIVEGVVSDTFTWSGGDDIFVGGSGNDTIRGREGYDWLSGGDGDDVIYGGAQDDVILGGGGDDRLYGEAGDDYISLGSGKDYGRDVNGVWVTYGAWGGAGNDTLVAGSGQAMIFGEDGDDTIILHQTPDGNPLWSRFEGGYGSDTISYERFINGVTIDMTTPYGVDPSNQAWFTLMGDQHFRSIENVTGSEHDDTLIGDALGNTLRGLAGDDILRGGDGEDILEGGAGADQLFGENGHDTASYDGSNSAVWIDFVNYEYFGGHAEGDTLDSIGRVIGSDFADTFFDRGGWNTRFWGGRGDDWFVASSGTGTTDYYYGDEDFDTVDYADVTSAININLGANIHSGGAANNRLYDIEQIVGSDFNDVILMDAKDNYIQGGKGDDTLYGGSGLDTYIYNFGDGRDVIHETEVGGGYDTLVLLGMNWADINLYSTDGGGGRQGAFNIDMADGGQVSLYRNQYHWENIEAGVDALDVGGVGAVDIGRLMAGAAGGNGNDTVIGRNDRADFIRGFAGNDTMYAAGSSTATEQDGNLIWGGRGNDSIWASVGDDEYIFEYGDGVDTIRDSGGDDRIQFGPSVAADDVIYEVVGNDLYIGLRDYSDPDLTASQVADRMRIINANSSPTSRIEYLTAGGVDIDLNKLDIFTSSSSGDGSGGGGTGGGGSGGGGTYPDDPDWPPILPPGGQLPPVVFDLDGDGLELVGLNESRVVFQSDSGGPLMRLGWIGADEGILALDRDGNGLIDRTDEISFKGDYEGATTDLEGMRGFDTNGDGVFSAEDDRWSEFKIWQDLNQNGIGSANEYMSLDEAGFTAIDLTLTASGHSTDNVGDSIYTNTAVATLTDGSSLSAFDVALRFGLARATGSALPDASIWEGFDLTAAGAMGIAYDANGDAVDLVSSWDMASAGPDGANWIDLSLHQDIFDELEAPQAPAANPDDPVTESFGVKPIVIDLYGDGLDLINPAQSPLQLDANGDGALDRLGWVGSGDGFLALDRNGSGTIDGISEISFVQDLAGAQTDLEGLRAFDSNGDGWLSGEDARFADFSVWVDSDFNALGTSEEMMTFGEAGIEAIALDHIEGTGGQEHGLANRLFGEAEIVWADGFSGGTAGDVELRAFRGFIDEQLIDERNRLLAQERSTDGAFAFDRHARRAAMEDMAREAAAPIADSAGNAPLGGGLGANMAGAGPEGVMSNNLGLVGDMLASDPRKRPVMEPGEAAGRLTAALQAESADRPQSGLGNAGFGSRWWADGDVAQAGAAGRTLADRLAALDQERQALGEPQGAGGGLPASEGLAEKQRLLQAIAAFRGSSGVATLRRGDEVATGQHDLFSSRRSLTQRSEGNSGSFFS